MDFFVIFSDDLFLAKLHELLAEEDLAVWVGMDKFDEVHHGFLWEAFGSCDGGVLGESCVNELVVIVVVVPNCDAAVGTQHFDELRSCRRRINLNLFPLASPDMWLDYFRFLRLFSHKFLLFHFQFFFDNIWIKYFIIIFLFLLITKVSMRNKELVIYVLIITIIFLFFLIFLLLFPIFIRFIIIVKQNIIPFKWSSPFNFVMFFSPSAPVCGSIIFMKLEKFGFPVGILLRIFLNLCTIFIVHDANG